LPQKIIQLLVKISSLQNFEKLIKNLELKKYEEISKLETICETNKLQVALFHINMA